MLRAVQALLFLLGLLVVSAPRLSEDWDTPWHLRAGEQILATRSTLPVDTFSFSHPGAPWPYKDLVAEVVLYSGFSVAGHAWFVLLRALAIVAIAAAASLARPRGHLLSWMIGCGFIVTGVAYRIAPRPLLFSVAAYPILLALLERARRAAPATAAADIARALAPIVLLHWLWAQLHREAMVGLVITLGFALYVVVAAILPPGRIHDAAFAIAPSRRFAVATAVAWPLALLLSVVNPSGASLITHSLAGLHSVGAWQRQTIFEWTSLGVGDLFIAFRFAMPVVCLAGAVLVTLLVCRAVRGACTSLDVWHLGLWLLFLHQTLDSVRFMPVLVVASSFALMHAVEDGMARLPRLRGRAPRGMAALCGLLLLIADAATHRDRWGVGEAPERFPTRALRFAAAAGLHERVANPLMLGGSVLLEGWPRFRVLVDGRNDMVYPSEFVQACIRAERDPATFRAMRASDGADWALASNLPAFESFAYLLDEPGWMMVFHSAPASVWVRADAYPALAARRLEYIPLLERLGWSPRAVELARRRPGGVERLEEELRRVIADVPDEVTPRVWLARFYNDVGRERERDRAIEELRRIRPDYGAFE